MVRRLTRSAQAVVEVVNPVMTMTKVAVRPVVLDDYGLPGSPGVPPRPIAGPDAVLITPAAYVFTVRNDGNVPIRDVNITDTFPSSTGSTVCTPTPVPPSGPNVGDLANTGVLDPGEAWEYDCVVPLTKADDADGGPGTANVPAVVTNVARASGTAFLGTATFPVAAGPVSAPVLIISPIASLTKTPCTGAPAGALTCSNDLVVRPDTDVTYRYLVSNSGDSTLDPVALLDDKCADIVYVHGDTDGDGLVDGGVTAPETWEYRCTSTINPPGPVVNNAAFYGVGPLGNLYLATATATVRVFDPAINLVKTARETLVPAGTAVTYDFEVTNVGESTLAADDVLEQIELVDVSLPALPGCATPTYVSETSTVTGCCEHRDVAICVHGTGERQHDEPGHRGWYRRGGPRPADAGVRRVRGVCRRVQPAIDVTKTANPTELLQTGAVTYTYSVRNTGDVPLADVATRITDDKCAPVTYVSGDEDLDGLLDTPTSIFEDSADETWLFTSRRSSRHTVNTVTVTGTPTDPGGERLCGATQVSRRRAAPCDVTDTATATVTVDDGSGIPPTPIVPPPPVVPPAIVPPTLPATVPADLAEGRCGDAMRAFGARQVLDGSTGLSDVVEALMRYDHAFVGVFGQVVGVATRADLQGPIGRMWLFGMVTLIELYVAQRIRARWPRGDWEAILPRGGCRSRRRCATTHAPRSTMRASGLPAARRQDRHPSRRPRGAEPARLSHQGCRPARNARPAVAAQQPRPRPGHRRTRLGADRAARAPLRGHRRRRQYARRFAQSQPSRLRHAPRSRPYAHRAALGQSQAVGCAVRTGQVR